MKEAQSKERLLTWMLLILARAYNNPKREGIRQHGMDERDLAFESDLLIPAEVEPAVYGTQKRNRVLGLIREMRDRGWVEMNVTPPEGVYRIVLTQKGAECAFSASRSWLARLLERIRGKGKRGPSEPRGDD